MGGRVGGRVRLRIRLRLRLRLRLRHRCRLTHRLTVGVRVSSRVRVLATPKCHSKAVLAFIRVMISVRAQCSTELRNQMETVPSRTNTNGRGAH